MSSQVPSSALQPLARPPLVLIVASSLLGACKYVVLHWVDGGVGFCPTVDFAQLLTIACDLSRVSSSALSADGCGGLVLPPLVPLSSLVSRCR